MFGPAVSKGDAVRIWNLYLENPKILSVVDRLDLVNALGILNRRGMNYEAGMFKQAIVNSRRHDVAELSDEIYTSNLIDRALSMS